MEKRKQYYYLISIKTNISAKYEQTKESSVVNRISVFLVNKYVVNYIYKHSDQ